MVKPSLLLSWCSYCYNCFFRLPIQLVKPTAECNGCIKYFWESWNYKVDVAEQEKVDTETEIITVCHKERDKDTVEWKIWKRVTSCFYIMNMFVLLISYVCVYLHFRWRSGFRTDVPKRGKSTGRSCSIPSRPPRLHPPRLFMVDPLTSTSPPAPAAIFCLMQYQRNTRWISCGRLMCT